MTLDEKIKNLKKKEAEEDYSEMSTALKENHDRFEFKRFVSDILSKFIFEDLDYDQVSDFDYVPVMFNNYKTNRITFKVSGKILLDYFKYDILLLAKANSRASRVLRFKNSSNNLKSDKTANSYLNPESKLTNTIQSFREYSWEFYEAHLMACGILGLTISDTIRFEGNTKFNIEEMKTKALESEENAFPKCLSENAVYAFSYIDIRGIKSIYSNVLSEQNEVLHQEEIQRTKNGIDKAMKIYTKLKDAELLKK